VLRPGRGDVGLHALGGQKSLPSLPPPPAQGGQCVPWIFSDPWLLSFAPLPQTHPRRCLPLLPSRLLRSSQSRSRTARSASGPCCSPATLGSPSGAARRRETEGLVWRRCLVGLAYTPCEKKVKVKPGGAPLPHHVFCWWQCLTRDGICDATAITVSVSPVSAPQKN